MYFQINFVRGNFTRRSDEDLFRLIGVREIFLGNPLAFTKAYEQIILSQSQSSQNKQDIREPMNIVS